MAGWRRVDAGAKENSLQLVMLWQARNNTDAQHMTIDTNGQMVMKSKQQLKEDFGIAAKPIATFKSYRTLPRQKCWRGKTNA